MNKEITKEDFEYFMTKIDLDYNDINTQRIVDMINAIPCKSFDLIWEDDKNVND